MARYMGEGPQHLESQSYMTWLSNSYHLSERVLFVGVILCCGVGIVIRGTKPGADISSLKPNAKESSSSQKFQWFWIALFILAAVLLCFCCLSVCCRSRPSSHRPTRQPRRVSQAALSGIEASSSPHLSMETAETIRATVSVILGPDGVTQLAFSLPPVQLQEINLKPENSLSCEPGQSNEH